MQACESFMVDDQSQSFYLFIYFSRLMDDSGKTFNASWPCPPESVCPVIYVLSRSYLLFYR